MRASGVIRALRSGRRLPGRIPIYLTLLLIFGCAEFSSPKSSSPAAEHFKKAEIDFEAGKYSEAIKEYRFVTAQFPEDEFAAAALYKTAFTEIYFKNPAADPGASKNDFQKLIQNYPKNPWKDQAQNWINFISQMEMLKTEREKLKNDLQRLLDLDMQSERKRRDLK